MADPFVGEIRAFAFGFTPQDWLSCDGSEVTIQRYPALFATIGTRFGGDGRTSFKVPDLRARAVACQYTTGTSPPNMPNAHAVGSVWGESAVGLNAQQMPSHTHGAKGYGSTGGVTQVGTPDGTSYLGLLRSNSASFAYDIWSSNALSDDFHPYALGPAGAVQPGYATPHNNNQPYLPLKFCICGDGYFMPNPG